MSLRKGLISLILLVSAVSGYSQQYHLVERKFSGGTGFYINGTGNVVTNEHVLQNCKNIYVRDFKEFEKAKLIKSNQKLDLAILKVEKSTMQFAKIANQFKKGEKAFIAGFPIGAVGNNNHFVEAQTTIVDESGPAKEAGFLQFASSASQGNSGGPLMDEFGNVIGVVRAKVDFYEVNFSNPENIKNLTSEQIKKIGTKVKTNDVAVAAKSLINFLQENNISYQVQNKVVIENNLLNSRSFITQVLCEING